MKKNYQKPLKQQKKNSIKENTFIIPEKKNSSARLVIIAFFVPVLLYLQTIAFGFTHFDDDSLISNNISFLSNFGNVYKTFLTQAFITKFSLFYRPVQTLSYMVDILISGGNNTWMYHFTNILLLGFISCLLFLLLRRFLIPLRLALLSTLIYCTHPLFVSTVAFIPTRGELLLTLFSLLSFLFFIELLQKRKLIYLFLNWAAFTIALFCKETAALLPLLFLIYHFTFSTEKRFEKKYIILIVLYFISGIIWFWLRSKAIAGISNQDSVVGLKLIFTNLRTIPESLEKFFLIFGISPIPSFSFIKTLVGSVILILIIILFFRNKVKTKKEKIFCLSWFFILMMPPMLFKHPLMDYLDHRFFFPIIGILLFLLFIIPKNWLKKGDINRYWLMIVVLIILSSFTFIKSRSYSNPMTYYNSAISQNPNSPFAYYNRGTLKSAKGDFQGAIEDYNKAISIGPDYAEAYVNRGISKAKTGNNDEAMGDFNKAIAIDPNNPDAYNNRGYLKSMMKDFKGAIRDLDKAIAISPTYGNGNAYNNRGFAKLSMGDNFGAKEDYTKAIEINPNYAEAYVYRGISKVNTGNNYEAMEDFNKAIIIEPNNPDAFNNRGYLKSIMKDFKGAIEDFNKVISVSPDYGNGKAYTNRGYAKLSLGNNFGAKADYTKAIEINPDNFVFYLNRAYACYALKDFPRTIDDCEKALKLNPNFEDAKTLKAKAQQEIMKIGY